MRDSARIHRKIVVALACVALLARAASGWSTKEHLLLTRLAAERLIEAPDTPLAMKAWLRIAAPGMRDFNEERDYLLHQHVGVFPRAADGIAYWATMPDLIAMTDSGERPKPVEPFGVGERLMHFIDVEYFMAEPSKRLYADDLSHKPALADFPRDASDPRYTQAGMLPFRVKQCYEKLVESIRTGRLTDEPGQYPRDEHAAKWAGFLAHYLEDNTQPHHATADYKSASYFHDVLRAPNVHADVEYRLVDDDQDDYPALRQEFWDAFVKELDTLRDPIEADDPWQATLQVSLASYDALPLIGHAAVAAYTGADGKRTAFQAETFFHFKGKVDDREMTVLEMKAHQMAWAVKRVQRLWLQAWQEANRDHPATGRLQQPASAPASRTSAPASGVAN